MLHAHGVVVQVVDEWKTIGVIALGFGILWVTAFMMVPSISYWGVGVVGALTAVALGFGIYLWRLSRKSRAMDKRRLII